LVFWVCFLFFVCVSLWGFDDFLGSWGGVGGCWVGSSGGWGGRELRVEVVGGVVCGGSHLLLEKIKVKKPERA